MEVAALGWGNPASKRVGCSRSAVRGGGLNPPPALPWATTEETLRVSETLRVFFTKGLFHSIEIVGNQFRDQGFDGWLLVELLECGGPIEPGQHLLALQARRLFRQEGMI